jgi:hypothetical protein
MLCVLFVEKREDDVDAELVIRGCLYTCGGVLAFI